MEWPPDPGLLSFDQVSLLVIDYLKTAVPMGFWSVSRHLDGRQVYLQVSDDAYGREPGGSHAWSDSFCQHVVAGRTPQIAPRAMDVPEYAEAGVARVLRIGAYIGIPIPAGDGEVFGTICGLDPSPRPQSLTRHAPTLNLLATLLGQIIIGDRLRTEATEREAKLRWRAFHDPLTGLANRALFRDRLNHATDLQRRDLRTVSVLLLDLDRFKDVNDRYGHSAGDLLLEGVAKRIRGCLRAGDTAARLGGDEFAILIEDGGQAESVARKLLDTLRTPFTIAGTEISTGVSIGVAEVPPFAATTNPEAVLAQADAAMYEAKRSGRNRYRMHTDEFPGGAIRHRPVTGTR
jgi:diguanylate cyclase